MKALGITIDADLEKNNFKFAGNTLADISSQLLADNFPTVAEYIGLTVWAPGTKPLVQRSKIIQRPFTNELILDSDYKMHWQKVLFETKKIVF